MPGSLLSIVFGWLAIHLVFFSLLAFLLVGLNLFGLLGPPPGPFGGFPGADHSATDLPPAQPDPTRPRATNGQIEGDTTIPDGPAAEEKTPGVTDAGSARLPASRQPKLIGGSLPVYPSGGPAKGGSDVAPGGFRPPSVITTPAGQPTAAPVSRESRLQQARRVFWNGDFESAEAAYLELIAEYPDDPELFGELGNLYQSMGKPQPALDAYFEAGIRAKAHGQDEKVRQVIKILEEEGDKRARQLIH